VRNGGAGRVAQAVTIRVLVIDDHPVVLDGLAAALSREPDLSVVARACSVAEARGALADIDPDVALVDVRLPDGSGLDLVAEHAGRNARPAWIVLSSFETDQHLAAALAAGASGYLLKTAPTAEIAAAIHSAATGRVAYTIGQLVRARQGAEFRLTPVDREIVRLLLLGQSNDEIAAAVGLGERSVEAHLARLYARLGVASRTELALIAEREGWLDLPADEARAADRGPGLAGHSCPERSEAALRRRVRDGPRGTAPRRSRRSPAGGVGP